MEVDWAGGTLPVKDPITGKQFLRTCLSQSFPAAAMSMLNSAMT